MKKTITIFLLLMTTLIASLNAQVGRTRFDTGEDMVTIDNVTVKTNNLYTLDSVKSPHIASFDIDLNNSQESKRVVASLFAAVQGNQPLKLTISKANYQNQIAESRDYNFATVSEILFPDLNGSSKEAARITVKISAQDVSTGSGGKEVPTQSKVTGGRMLSSNYKITMGNLPTQRVTRIGNLRITSQSFNRYLNFSIDVTRIDSKPWKDWFNIAENGKTEEGRISFMDQSMANELLGFSLSDVEIVSISESSASSSDGIPKTIVGLRARKFDISK